MIDEFEARRRILEATPAPGANATKPEEVDFTAALGRFAAEDLAGKVDLPGFDNSSMDGYAVRAAEAKSGSKLTVTGEQPAGVDFTLQLNPGEAIRIFTGAPVPSGANAVVMQEDVKAGGTAIEIVEGVEAGENIRPRGGDICAGQKIFAAGARINPAAIGLLASQGYHTVAVRPRPRVAIVTTGDELVDTGPETSADSLKPGEIFNSNGPMLAALTRQFGGDPLHFHAPDESGELGRTLSGALDAAAFVLIAGGVSVGERDLVKGVLQQLGVESDFWRVRVKPGKPFLFGHRPAGEERSASLVFGLPGNPVSAFVTFLLFAAPSLVKAQSGADHDPEELPLEKIRGPAAQPLTNPGDRPHYLRMKIDDDGAFRPIGLQQSHAVFGLSRADVLLRMEAGQDFSEGEEVNGYRIG